MISRLLSKIEIHRPIVDPVRPVLGEGLAGDDAVLVLAHLHDLAAFDHDLAALLLQRLLSVGDGNPVNRKPRNRSIPSPHYCPSPAALPR